MAYLTLGPEFYEKEPKLYDRVLNRVKGHCEKVVNSIHFIKFESNRFGEGEFCIAIIAFTRFHSNPYIKHIVSNRFGKL